MPKCDFSKVALQIALQHGCSPVNLLHIFRTPFPRNTSEWLLKLVLCKYHIVLKSLFVSSLGKHNGISGGVFL